MNDPDPTSDITKPHDALFKGVFGDPERAAELLRSSLPRRIRRTIDWTSLRRIDASFVDEELRDLHADLLFTAKVKHGGTVLLYLVLEHKSTDDRFTVFQLLRYIVRIWERWRAENPNATHLPPVLPFVLHHGAHAWRSPRSLRELIQLDGLGPALVALQPDLTFRLDDLAAGDEPRLRRRRLAVRSLLPLLHLQMLRRDLAAAAQLLAWRQLHLRLLARPGGQQLLQRLISYVSVVSNDDPQKLRVAYARIHKTAEAHYMSTAEQLRQEGRKAAEEQFRSTAEQLRQEGHQEGQLRGRRETLATLLEQRFGPLPPAMAERVATASADELAGWTSRILTAATLDELLA